MNISHRDLKIENILVDTESNDFPTKIIDFGFSIETLTPNEKLTTVCGTPAYMAPELCHRKEYIGPQVDIWAAGVVFYTILFGQEPFKSNSEKDLYMKIIRGKLKFP